jgi:phosphonate transport system substrate-binding protein
VIRIVPTAGRGLLLILLAICPALVVASPVPGELSLGTIAMDIPAVMFQRLRPLAEYLSRELKQPVRVRPSPDLSKAVDEVAQGRVDIAYLTPIAYVKAQRSGQVQIVAKTVTRGAQGFRLMVVTRADSPIATPADLAGKRFAFGDPAALVQRAVLANAGVRLEALGAYRFLGHYDNVARGVLNGDFDAGILKDTSAYAWTQQGLRILHRSPELPPYNFAVSRRLSPAQIREIQGALLRLRADDPQDRRVIKALDEAYDGFASADDSDYDIIRTLVRPFEN